MELTAGDRLAEVHALRFSDPAVTAQLLTKPPLPLTDSPLPDYGRFRVQVPADASPGRIDVRAVGRHGVSNPRILRLTERPCSVPESISHDPQKPSELPLGHLVMAHSTPANVDYFAVAAEKGQSVRIQLAAQKIDSRMIGQLKLLDPQGRTVCSSRGGDGIDPELNHSAEQNGRYVLAVHDFLYRGGHEYPYQLKADWVETSATPQTASHRLQRQMDDVLRVCLERVGSGMPARNAPNTLALGRWNRASGEIHWLSSGGQESGDRRTFQPPCLVGGQFHADRGQLAEQQVIQFQAEKGQRLALEIFSERLGQPTDVRLTIEQLKSAGSGSPQWQQLQVSDDSQAVGEEAISLRTTDPTSLFEAPETATYRALVRDLDTGASLAAHQGFLLDIREPKPAFDLLAFRPTTSSDGKQFQPSGSLVARGGVASLRVFVIRRDGWTGPVKLSVDGLPAAANCRPVWVPADQDHAQINLPVDPEAGSWVGPVSVVGRTTVGEKTRTRRAVSATVQWAKSESRPFVRSRLTHSLVLAVSEQDLCPLSLRWGEGEVREATPGSSLEIPVRLTRRDGAQAPCTVRPRDLPAGFSAGELKIAADQTEAMLTLKIADNVTAGTYTPWLEAETKVTWRPNPQRLEQAKQYREMLQGRLDSAESDEQRTAIQAAIEIADKRLDAAEPAAKAQEINLFVPSNNMTIRVVAR